MKYRLQDLIDIEHFQNLQDRLNEIYSFPSSIIDNEGNVLTATAWQEICTKFHRGHEECELACIESDKYILSHLHEANPAVSYRCPHGLVDNATPIIVDGIHYGNFFTGQFFLEPPDLDFFRAQAKKYGFDEEAYIAAVKKVPVWSQEQLNSYLFFIKGLIAIISESALKKLREIETRKQIEESEERAHIILREMTDGFWITDPGSGRIVDVNDAMCRMLGYTHREVLQMSVADVEAIDTPEQILKRLKQLTEIGSTRFESRFLRKDGNVIDVDVSLTYLPRRNLAFCFHRDITERKRAEQEKVKLEAQLQQAQKMESVGRLAGGVAHDFNNMLGVILGHAEMALDRLDPGEPLHEDLVAIRTAASRSAELTRQLLAFARKQTVSPRVLDLNKTIEGMLLMLNRLIGEDIDLRWQPGPSLWPIQMDPTQIDQILVNLCVNSRDAIANVGRITIETANSTLDKAFCRTQGAAPGDYVLLVVSDNGSGMSKEILAQIFEPFFTTKGVGQGTGLGLATVYGIVRQNRGFISTTSEPGQGATFTIYLPRHLGPLEQTGAESSTSMAATGKETILLVEDEPSVLCLAETILKGHGYRVLAANTPGEAIHLAREPGGEINLLLTDVVMPEMNGRDLARNLLAIYPNMKCLFMSGYTAEFIAPHGVLEKGMSFLQKPFSNNSLAAKVRQVLDSE